MWVLLVGGPLNGAAIETDSATVVAVRARGHDPHVGSAFEGYGPVDQYGMDDPKGLWPVHHGETTLAKVNVAFARDELAMSAMEAAAIEKTAGVLEASADAVEDAWLSYCEAAVAVA